MFPSCVALVSALAVVASPEASGSPSYRWLTTGELGTLLRGSRIVEADDRPSWMHTPEEFSSNGNYVLYADNYEAHGKYSFRNDAVCVQAERDPEVCRRILIDNHGRYWIVGRDNSGLVKEISVKPLR